MLKPKKAIVIRILAMGILLMPFFVSAASHPSVQLTNIMSDALWGPNDVAVGPHGNIYVADGHKDRVVIYDRKGNVVNVLKAKSPSALAMDSAGKLYIGASEQGRVSIYNGKEIVGSIGQGDNEFSSVDDICITGDMIYVVDGSANAVKVYGADRMLLKTITEGLRSPAAVAVTNDELFVINKPMVSDPYTGSGLIVGASIEVFDLTGSHLSTMGEYGNGEGQLRNPTDIFADDNGRLYVADAYHSVILVFGTDGTYLGVIRDEEHTMRTTTGVIMGKDKRLMTTSLSSSEVLVFGIDDYTFLDALPASLSFDAQSGKATPESLPIMISNHGKGVLSYTLSSDQWITISQSSGSLNGGSTAEVAVSIDPGGLAIGTHSGMISVADNAGASEVIGVTLNVHDKPVLAIDPGSLSFVHTVGNAAPASENIYVSVSNGLFNEQSWAVTAQPEWMHLNPTQASGNATTNVVASVDPSLPMGTYNGDIVIDADFLSDPVIVKVAYDVVAAGSIDVSTNSNGAQFSISGPKDYNGSGTDWHVDHVPDGTYTITFIDIDGYRTPPQETRTLSGGGVISFSGNYAPKRSDEIVVSLKGGKSSTDIMLFSALGTELLRFTPFDGFRGGGDIAVGDINGDGSNEIIAGLGGIDNPALIALFDRQGQKIDEFVAFGGSGGVTVVAADMDKNGSDEILAVNGDNTVRIIIYNGGPSYIDPGIRGELADAGDINGDGSAEIVVVSGSDVIVYDLDTSAWTVTKLSSMTLDEPVVNLSIIDLDHNGTDEIIALSGGDVVIIDSGVIRSLPGLKVRRGKDVVAGDVNADGLAEIVLGSRGGKVMIYGQDGELLNVIRAYKSKSDVSVSLGELGY